ncbi:MAG: hypothetical protein ABIN91_11675 [Mucilaginibacter sp.]|uniref:hypothetical protein n=1 Tax=Mucilaginibacter sp. TaxID=1882438 RepID=UPI003263695B
MAKSTHPENTKPVDNIAKEDLFEYLFTDLKEAYETYIKYVLTTTATQILIIGWFITSSDKASKFIVGVSNKGSTYVFYLVIATFILVEICVSQFMWRESKKLGGLIKELEFVNERYFERKIMNGWLVTGMVLAHVVLYILLAVIICLFSDPQFLCKVNCVV